MHGSKRSSNQIDRILSPDEQRAIADQLVAQRREEDALRREATGWPIYQRRRLRALINRNRTARFAIWHILNIAEETLWPTLT